MQNKNTPGEQDEGAQAGTQAAATAFVQRWQGASASELATAQSFVIELCELLGVERPHPGPEQAYEFERPVTFQHGDGSHSAGRIDLYRRGCFIWESKKLREGARQGAGFDEALLRARSQAEAYARALPATEGRPPFLVVVDVGHVIELYAEFSRSGATYTPFPDPRNHRIRISELLQPAVRQRLRLLWSDPLALDPARASSRVTREVAGELALLARSLEADGHAAHSVAAFLTRCLFSLFAEDVGLLPPGPDGHGAFETLLRQHRQQPATLARMLQVFWDGLDKGGFNPAIAHEVLRFNGKVFKGAGASGYALPLKPEQVDGLLRAAKANWREVEPAIFGTLLERALDPAERHQLGAHYTPRAYVERLVLPTVVEPLREDWANARAAAFLLATEAAELDGKKDSKKREAKLAEARAELHRFHHQLCSTRVLDPACGSGNFLYITLEHLKRLEGEVLDALEQLGEAQDKLALEGETVTLQQLRGIELNPRAAALAELVLWIGYLQWQLRTRGPTSIAEPVVHDYGNIECRDAVLAHDPPELLLDSDGKPLLRWDGKTRKPHPVTGELVPDERAQVEQWRYPNPRPAEWPAAEFIVGNPPFIGNKRMREVLGTGYVEALRGAWPEVPDSADFVMFWWHGAAQLVQRRVARSMGLITTNSLTMIFNRRVVDQALTDCHLAFAIPDHPWVDSANGAAVRIAMTVLAAGSGVGTLAQVTSEVVNADGEAEISVATGAGTIHADLKLGANIVSAQSLVANIGLSNRGVIPHGAGFILDAAQRQSLEQAAGRGFGRLVRPYRNGKDLTTRPRDSFVIDPTGYSVNRLRSEHPAIYQWLHDRVKPERDHNRSASIRDNWWLHARPRADFRPALDSIPRYIATGQVAKHRVFQWLDAEILPDDKLIAIASADAQHLGVLSSQVHVAWALAAGGRLGVGNDPVYSKSTCFDKFPFPSDDTGLTTELATRIRDLAEQLDAHRKRQQAAHEAVTLTGLYNVLDTLRRAAPLTPKDKQLHELGLVGVLKSLHDELDAAVLAAYGWSDLGAPPFADDEAMRAWTDALLQRLVALNAQRAAEEAQGQVRWLRPEFQDPQRRAAAAAAETAAALAAVNGAVKGAATQTDMLTAMLTELLSDPTQADEPADAAASAGSAITPPTANRQPWPEGLPAQMRAVAERLAAHPQALSEAQLAAAFSGRGPWKKRLPQILETLEALGRARRVDDDGGAWLAC